MDPGSSRRSTTGTWSSSRAATILLSGQRIAAGVRPSIEELELRLSEQRERIDEAIADFAINTIEHVREESELLSGEIDLPATRTRFDGRHALIVVRGAELPRGPRRAERLHPRRRPPDHRRRRRRRRRPQGRASNPDVILGDMDSRHRRRPALRRRADRPRLSRRPGAGPRAAPGGRPRPSRDPRGGHQPGRRDAARPREGSEADRHGRRALQPDRVPRQEPRRDVVDLPDPAAGGGDPGRRQGRQPALPARDRGSPAWRLFVARVPLLSRS